MEIKYNNEKVVFHSLVSLKDAAIMLNAPDIDSLEVIYTFNEINLLRVKAYKAESDPLYMSWQFDQTSEAEQAWRSKVEEIKARYPFPA
ncbi:hypothetical protein CWB72_10520 [Pseudoalteromonas phenolica]|uniref:hypothetical protein n=1 Tax=Pseudoalteromonas phenolica TaxID=161398 RepID=UPI00110A370D|nr:hypothetical protein [Pseudoalteromonas phenolica]TMN89462.1 hypothetical protein CWB72_10520 [Pseudoalteromonas phenolica]